MDLLCRQSRELLPAQIVPDSVQQDDAGPALADVAETASQLNVSPVQPSDAFDSTLAAATDDRATRTVAALEQWLAAIHVPREPRHP